VREIRDRVSEAISELTPDHRAVILLREVEGLSYEEISRVMRCSKGTVMSRLHYARKKLQKRLKDCL
jgi:RNA polymerase sigma-70 factor (ECF subfamily)